jgi:hypothetical protein
MEDPAVLGTCTNSNVELPARGASPLVAAGTVFDQKCCTASAEMVSTAHVRFESGAEEVRRSNTTRIKTCAPFLISLILLLSLLLLGSRSAYLSF